MPSPIPADAHISRYLTNIAVSYVQRSDAFVGGQVFPFVPVNHQSDLYLTYPKGYFFRDEMQERPLGGEPVDTGYTTGQGTYACIERALSHPIDDRLTANADDPMDPERTGAEMLQQKAMINLDRIWAAKYFVTSVWGQADYTGVPSGPTGPQFLQFDQSGSKPIQVVRARASAMGGTTGFRPNTLVLGRSVYDTLLDHPDIVDRVKYTQGGAVQRAILAALFEVDRVLVAEGVQNTANEGQADAVSYIVNPKAALLAYAAPAPSLNVPSAGYTFGWSGLLAAAAATGTIFRHRVDTAYSNKLHIRTAFDTQIVASDLGQFFTAAVA